MRRASHKSPDKFLRSDEPSTLIVTSHLICGSTGASFDRLNRKALWHGSWRFSLCWALPLIWLLRSSPSPRRLRRRALQGGEGDGPASWAMLGSSAVAASSSDLPSKSSQGTHHDGRFDSNTNSASFD